MFSINVQRYSRTNVMNKDHRNSTSNRQIDNYISVDDAQSIVTINRKIITMDQSSVPPGKLKCVDNESQ